MRLDPYRLLVLRAVAEAGGVMAAGRRLHLAPSGVSQHLAALERETGLVLLDRSRRGGQRPAQLTATGRRLADHAARLAQVLADAEADVLGMHDPVQGPVRLAAFPTAIRGLVVPALRTLARTRPGIHPTVVELDQQFALPALHTGELDLVLTEDDAEHPSPAEPGHVRVWLLDDSYQLLAPATWPTPASLEDLAERPWIDGPPGSTVARVLQRLRATTALPLAGAHSCLEFPAVLTLVAAGMGAALVPDLALTDGPVEGVQVLDLPRLGARSISATHLHQSPRPVVRALVEAFTATTRSHQS